MVAGVGFSTASYNAVNGYQSATQNLSNAAQSLADNAAEGIVDPAMLVQVKQLHAAAKAQALVINTLQQLSQDLLSNPRH